MLSNRVHHVAPRKPGHTTLPTPANLPQQPLLLASRPRGLVHIPHESVRTCQIKGQLSTGTLNTLPEHANVTKTLALVVLLIVKMTDPIFISLLLTLTLGTFIKRQYGNTVCMGYPPRSPNMGIRRGERTRSMAEHCPWHMPLGFQDC